MEPDRYRTFPMTHWSLVRRAGSSDETVRQQALAILLNRYQPALVAYLQTAKGIDGGECKEVVQEFTAKKILEFRLFERASENRGRFRTFLIKALNNFVIDRYRHNLARRAVQGGNTEDYTAHGSLEVTAKQTPTPWNIVEAAWARTLIHEVLANMKKECSQTGRDDVWQVFDKRILRPLFEDEPAIPYEELAPLLCTGSPTQTANLLVTAKRMYARLLRAAIGEYEKENGGIEAEIRDLCRALQVPSTA